MQADKTKRVLIIDDDLDYVFLLQEAIEICQPTCEVEVVTRATDLMAYLTHRGRPNLIFLCINMPISNGFAVLRFIKSSDQHKQIPVVILSVSADKEDIFNAYTIGANAYLVKPRTFDELSRRIALFTEYWIHTVKPPCSFWKGTDWYFEVTTDN